MKLNMCILIFFTYLNIYSQNDSIYYCHDCLTSQEVEAYERSIGATKVYIPIIQANKFTCESDLKKIMPTVFFSTVSHNSFSQGCCYCDDKDSIYVRIDTINRLHTVVYYQYYTDCFYALQSNETKCLPLLSSVHLKVFTIDSFLTKYFSFPLSNEIEYPFIQTKFNNMKKQLNSIVGYQPKQIKEDNLLIKKVQHFLLLSDEPFVNYDYKYKKDLVSYRYESKLSQIPYQENGKTYIKLSLMNEIEANLRLTTLLKGTGHVLLKNKDIVILVDIDRTDLFKEKLHQNYSTTESIESHIQSLIEKYQAKK